MQLDAEFYVAVGFFIFVLLLGYLGVRKILNAAFDTRATKTDA